YSQTSASHHPKSMFGSHDIHSTLTVSPGWRTWPAAGEISLAEYAPVFALEVSTNCGAKLSATATMVKTNPRIFIFLSSLGSVFPPRSEILSKDFIITCL